MPERPQTVVPHIKVMGRSGSAIAYKIRDYLQRSDVPFEWIELKDEQQARMAGVDSLQDPLLPTCVFPDGTQTQCPTVRQITEKLGWFQNPATPSTTSPFRVLVPRG